MAQKETENLPWIPLEINPVVMNAWAEQLGLVVKVNCFDDVYGLDPELMALVPQPCKAFLLCFPITDELAAAQKIDDERIAKEGQHALDPTIMFMKQTIPNACGTMALLHALANTDVTIAPMSPLAKIFEELQPLTPEQRSESIENLRILKEAHLKAAEQGQSYVPSAWEDVDMHFIAIIRAPSAEDEKPTPTTTGASAAGGGEEKDSSASMQGVEGQKKTTAGEQKRMMRLVELDGRRAGPIDHGESKDFMNDVANLLRTKFIPYSTSQNFGLISLGPPAF